MIVPWPAGGSTDIGLRALATATEKHLGQSIVIENRGGAAGTLGGAQMAANAKPDGYTISQIPITIFRLPYMGKTAFDPTKDFTYIIGISGYTFGVVVRSDAPWKTFQELLADAKANPGKINYGTLGAGTSLHITMEQIAKQQGIKWTHVQFRGQADTTTSLLGGHDIPDLCGLDRLGTVGERGQTSAFGDVGCQPHQKWPTVPILKEVGINMISNSPYGLAGPKGMDPSVVKVLHDAFKKGMEEPAFGAAMSKLDQELFYLSSADYHDFAMKLIVEEKRIIEELGLKEL